MKIFKYKEILPQLPNLLFRGRIDFKFELLPFTVKGISWKKRWNFLVAGLNQFFLPARPWGYPVIAQVEPSNVCNLSCSLCFTASQNTSRPPAKLPFPVFKQFIDDVGDYLLVMVLWNWGEPFLNPDIYKIIQYATAKHIVVHSSTNGNVVFDDEAAGKIVDSGLTSLIFAVDGATQETYSLYRTGGHLHRVLENIRTLLRVRKEKASLTPKITMRFVVMKQNEAQLPLVKQLAEELGVDYFAVKSVDMPPEIGAELDQMFRPESEQYRRYEYEKGTFKHKKKPFVCMRPWKRVTMDALGEIISCEFDYKNAYSFGKIGTGASVPNVWKSVVSRTFRRQFNKGHNDFSHCLNCTYKDIQADECNLFAYPIHPGEQP